jgi:aryl-alcohol dehydrogenase-like predicted oxidoreductase
MADLPTRPLGHSTLQVSVLGLGCNNFGRRVDLEGTREVVAAAIEEGATFFDTADIYGGPDGHGRSEELLGQVLRGRRDQVVLATKFGMDMGDGRGPRGSAEYIRHAVQESLRRLQTDVIDLYWYHEPDGETPIEETLSALHELVEAGTVRAIGASNFDAEQIEEADAVAREHELTRFTAVQNEYSLLVREPEHDVLPACQRLGLGFVPYFPLASGLLTGKYRRDQPAPEGTRLASRDQIASDEQFEAVEALRVFAEERGISLIDVAIGALLANPTVASVIAGATKPDQVRANAAAARWEPTDEDLSALQEALGSRLPQ